MAVKKVTATRNAKGLYKYRATWRVAGKAFQKILWAVSDRDAETQFNQLQGQVEESPTWSQAAALFLQAKPDVTIQYQQDIARVTQALINAIGDRRISDTTLPMIAAFIRQKAIATCGRTGNKYRTTLLTIARWIRSQGLADVLPFEYVASIPYRAVERRPPPIELLPRYLEALPPHLKPMIKLLITTGARSGAVCKLRQADVLPDRMRLHEKGGVIREILLDADLRSILTEAALARESQGYHGILIFVNGRRNQWTPEKLIHACQCWWRKAGLPHLLIHELRHLFTTIAAQEYDAPMLQAGRGDRSRATAERYTHLGTQAAAEVGRYVRGVLAPIIAAKPQDSDFIGGGI